MRDATGRGPSDTLRRPRLEQVLDESVARRLTALVAPAGFGKTTLLTQWADRHEAAWYSAGTGDGSLETVVRGILDALRLHVPDISADIFYALEGLSGPGSPAAAARRPDSLAAAICEDLDARLRHDTFLVLDDVHELSDEPETVRFVAALCRSAPRRLHLLVATRDELPFPVARMKVDRSALVVHAPDLAFTLDEVCALVDGAGRDGARAAAPADDAVAAAIVERTGGWPVAVVLSLRGADVTGAERPDGGTIDGTLFEYLAEEIIDTEEPAVVRSLVVAAHLPWIDDRLAAALGLLDQVQALLRSPRRGAYLTRTRRPDALEVSPLVREFIRSRPRLGPADLDPILRSAVSWFATEGAFAEALQCSAELADPIATRQLLDQVGSDMLTHGLARSVLDALQRDADRPARDELLLLEAEARQMLGDWEGATACYRRLAPDDGPLTPGLAWRLGFLSHMRGDVATALETYRRGLATAGSDADRAALFGWAASAHWLRGERDEAQELAAEAIRLAREAGDSRALATAHTVLAMVAALDGDRASNDHHYLRALEHAERARDVVQTIRIRSNRASHFLEEGRFDEALAELDIAHRLSDLTGFALWRAMTLSNRAQVLFFRGRLEESLDDLRASRDIFRSMGSTLEAYPLAYIGDVHRVRGHAGLARVAYEEAIRLAEGPSDQQALVPALSGLARLLARDEPDRAVALARRASASATAVSHVRAVVAEGVAELAGGDRVGALERARTATELARARHDLPGLAEAAELMARAVDPHERLAWLEEARALWAEIGAPIGVAGVDLAIAEERGGLDGQLLAERCATALRDLGAKGLAWEAEHLARRLARDVTPPVAIASLGAFGVSIDGRLLTADVWQSRIARDVLAMLVANRGRPVHREIVIERIWPDDDPGKASNRLAVAVSTIRSVLDPERRFGADHFVGGDKDTLSLQLEHVDVDVELLFGDARRGLAELRAGRVAEAAALLRRAESRYVGDFLEDRPHADWAISTREEARATYVQIARTLAELDLDAGDFDSAARRYLRIIERDPYDESAHLQLVATMSLGGRHGTARRLYGTYAARMAELDVEPAPFPGGVGATRASGSATPH